MTKEDKIETLKIWFWAVQWSCITLALIVSIFYTVFYTLALFMPTLFGFVCK